MNKPRIPIALQQAVMRCLREKLQLARQHFAVEFPEPSIVYQQRGTSAGTAWLQSWEIRLNPVLLLETNSRLSMRWCRMSWRTCWCFANSAVWRRTAANGAG